MPTPYRSAQLTDAELVERIRRAHDTDERSAAFTLIYERYLSEVSWLCGRELGQWNSALDAVQDTFANAFHELAVKRTPVSNLSGWLRTIARRSCYRYMHGGSPGAGHRRGPDVLLRSGEVADIADAGPGLEEVAIKAALRADAERLVAIVAATLTERQRTVYELSFRQQLRGQALGRRLGVDAAQASRLTNETALRMKEGIGALILAQAGRQYCAVLASILDRAAWNGDNFSSGLRDRIIRHFGTCSTCDHCATCANKQEELGRELIPVLIPILFAGVLNDRLERAVNRTGSTASRHSRGPRGPVQPIANRRRPRPRWAVPLAAVAVAALIIAGLVAVPWLLAGSHAADSPPTGQLPPAQLTGASSQVWRLTPWNRPGQVPAGSSQWEFVGNCTQASTCTYTLHVVKYTVGPDVWYASLLPRPPSRVFRLHAVPGGYLGVATFGVGCIDNINGPQQTFRNTVNIRVIDTVMSDGRRQAKKIAIVWTSAIIYSPAADQAVGCKERSYTDTATATLGG
jgi:RNA polymerase sigma factor (sigma-70 family)